ncbi:hypothetical protein [Haloferula helveola]
MSFQSKGPDFAWVLGAAVVLGSPFLVRQLSVSRVLWWSLLVASALVILGLTGVLGWMFVVDPSYGEFFRFRIGIVFVLTYPLVHFAGVLCVRKRILK